MGGGFWRELRGNFFPQRIVHIWNRLPEEAIEMDIIKSFKRDLDKCMDQKAFEEYR